MLNPQIGLLTLILSKHSLYCEIITQFLINYADTKTIR